MSAKVAAKGKTYDVADIMPASMIAAELFVSRTSIFNWHRRYEAFPAPVIDLPGARMWSLSEVRAWLDSLD